MTTVPAPAAPAPDLIAEGLGLYFGSHRVFENLDLTVPGGKILALLGASGVGKTSLLKILAGLAPPSAGRVRAGDGVALHGRVAYMGQTDLLFPWLTVLGNVMLGSRLRGERADPARALDLLERVGLAGRAEAMPASLSGGMRQRAALARTLYENRPVVLMDEPFSALDALTRARIQELAAEVLAGRTVLLITHDPFEACRLGHQLLIFSGQPARLGAAITVRGAPPRPPDDPALLQAQGRLMRELATAPEEAGTLAAGPDA